MKVRPWCRLFVMLSLVVLSPFDTRAPSAHSQSASEPGSEGAPPGTSQKVPTPIKPSASKPSGTGHRLAPSDMSRQTLVPDERAQALEKRLRSGQMERPLAQDQVSDRLEQLHRDSTERSTGNTATGQ
jgi:hypothetical protein